MDEVLSQAVATLGKGGIRSLHLNDSQTPLRSNRDKHANVGEGELGDLGCAAFLSAPGLQNLPCVLETPGHDRKGPDRAEVEHARALRERGVAERKGAGGGRQASSKSKDAGRKRGAGRG
jgi:deoxyribonuclease-4